MSPTREPSQAAGSRRFTVDEFRRMAEVGIFAEDDRLELLEGEVIPMSPIGKRHAAIVAKLSALFARSAEGALPWPQNPIVLGASELYPDIALLQARPDFYAGALPTGKDVMLLIEVSDTTLGYDQRSKVPIYAREGVPEVWVVDLTGEKVWVYRKPEADGYQEMRAFARGETLRVQSLPDLVLRVDDVLG